MMKTRDKWLRLTLSVAAMLTVAACETGCHQVRQRIFTEGGS